MPVPVDLNKLSDVIKNDVVKKTVYDKLVAKVNSIDTSGLVLKNNYDTDKLELKNKISDTKGLVKKTDYNAKITEIDGKIPSISGLDTTAALTAVEDKIPNVSNLVKKQIMTQKLLKLKKKLTDHDHDKYITTPEFNNLEARVFTARLAQASLIAKTYCDDKLKDLNQNIISNKTKDLF